MKKKEKMQAVFIFRAHTGRLLLQFFDLRGKVIHRRYARRASEGEDANVGSVRAKQITAKKRDRDDVRRDLQCMQI